MRPLLQLGSLAWAMVTMPLALLLVANAATWTGRLFALVAMCFAVLPVLASWGRSIPGEMRRRVILSLLAMSSLASMALVLRAPRGSAVDGARAQHQYSLPGHSFSRFALGNILPEVDQLLLGFTLATLSDPLLTIGQAAELKRVTTAVYRVLEADPDFHALGSSMPDVYHSLTGADPDVGHAYCYIPRSADLEKPLPTILFLHGSGGNFKGYLWVLSQVAEKCRALVIAPSYGMGDWRGVDALTVINRAMSSLAPGLRVDRSSLHVIGLSNGGLGVSQLLRAPRETFKSLVFLSPVFDHAEIERLAPPGPRLLPPVLILTGDRDDRVPPSYIEDSARLIRTNVPGAAPTIRYLVGANHFAIFSRQREVVSELSAWIASHR